MTIKAFEGPHWDWALGVYRRPGVSPACVVLQDDGGVDVNVLLTALYAGVGRGLKVDAAELGALLAASVQIRTDVVRPLRGVRRVMKEMDFGPDLSEAAEAVRGFVKTAELASEQLELAMLADVATGWQSADSPRSAEAIAADVVLRSGGDAAALAVHIATVAGAAQAQGKV